MNSKDESFVPEMRRILGLDSIRFIAALWVFFSHGGVPRIELYLDKFNPYERLLIGVYNNLWSGPAAVIVFFVISGFVIHYPNLATDQLNLKAYFIRRYIRIVVPLATITALCVSVGLGMDFWTQ